MQKMIAGFLDHAWKLVIPAAVGWYVGGLILEKKNQKEEEEEDVEVKEAHVEPARQDAIARDWGTIPRISTERNILAGQAVGQTRDYTIPIGQFTSSPVNEDWTAYSYMLMTTEPTFGQDCLGRATGVQ